jgi:hypothetical protein
MVKEEKPSHHEKFLFNNSNYLEEITAPKTTIKIKFRKKQ